MAKKAKEIVQTMNGKVLTKREASRRAQNERRKIQRRLANELSRETGKKVSWKESYEVASKLEEPSSIVKGLTRTYEKTLAKKGGGYEQNIESIAKSVSEFTKYRYEKYTDIFGKNEAFKFQINQATKKDGLSLLDSNEVHAFYAATQDIWSAAKNASYRNALILQEFGLHDLKQVYDLLMNEELNPQDFGFDDEELFEAWLDEIRENIQLDELRDIIQEELNGEYDEPDEKYNKIAIANIRLRTSMLRYG